MAERAAPPSTALPPFQQFLDAQRDVVWRLLVSRVGTADAEDCFQETFIAAARHIGGLREDGKFGSWLFGIAHQKCIQRWRKRTEALLDEIPEARDEFEDGPDDLLIRREQEAARPLQPADRPKG